MPLSSDGWFDNAAPPPPRAPSHPARPQHSWVRDQSGDGIFSELPSDGNNGRRVDGAPVAQLHAGRVVQRPLTVLPRETFWAEVGAWPGTSSRPPRLPVVIRPRVGRIADATEVIVPDAHTENVPNWDGGSMRWPPPRHATVPGRFPFTMSSLPVDYTAQLDPVFPLYADAPPPPVRGPARQPGAAQPLLTSPFVAAVKVTNWGLLPAPTGISSGKVVGGSLLVATTYYYVITALTEAGETTASAETSQTTDATNRSISLTWTAVSGATGYRVYRGTVSGNNNALVAQVTSPSNTDSSTDTLLTQSPPSTNTAGVGTSFELGAPFIAPPQIPPPRPVHMTHRGAYEKYGESPLGLSLFNVHLEWLPPQTANRPGAWNWPRPSERRHVGEDNLQDSGDSGLFPDQMDVAQAPWNRPSVRPPLRHPVIVRPRLEEPLAYLRLLFVPAWIAHQTRPAIVQVHPVRQHNESRLTDTDSHEAVFMAWLGQSVVPAWHGWPARPVPPAAQRSVWYDSLQVEELLAWCVPQRPPPWNLPVLRQEPLAYASWTPTGESFAWYVPPVSRSPAIWAGGGRTATVAALASMDGGNGGDGDPPWYSSGATIIVAGPFLVDAAQVWCAGAVQGDILGD